MKSYIEKSFLKLKIDELVTSRGHIAQWGTYENCKYEYLTIDGVRIGEFNYNRDGFTSYAFNKKCYNVKQFKCLQQYCPIGHKCNSEGWHKRTDGYYGRIIGKNGYTLTTDLQFILDHIIYYLINIEEV